MRQRRWTSNAIPDQTGRVAIVTGANSGIGLETARALAGKGATVILACRSLEKAETAADVIRADRGPGVVEVRKLDLSDLESVRRFASAFVAVHDRLDLLIANAGVMMPPSRQQTADGFELQMGTNHFGHFALIDGLLAPTLATEGARIVVVASNAHKAGVIDLDDLHWERRRFRRWISYGDSKLANLLFTYELQRRLEVAGSDVMANAAHPGWTDTNLARHNSLFDFFAGSVAMVPADGALPTLYAATSEDARPAGYYGPSGIGELKGPPVTVRSSRRSHDPRLAERLWARSVELTGADYAALAPAVD